MKKVYLFLLFIGFASQGFAKSDTIRNPTVPKEIVASFAKAHPDAKLVNWAKANSTYLVSYREASYNLWTVYDLDGGLIESKWRILAKDLPAATQDYIKENNTQGIQEYYKVMEANGTINYEITALTKSYVFDSEGVLYKTIESLKK
ncbi:hypothetical protein [Cytophaga aurantiaca]|uniref:hypothetical protein n=1 Tax=Cytophaga aurantiaca TaxID=29530 RepID=UPI00037BF28F|nr:hypothetical protein [Cytophaga aurantiaca]